jgi:hypothetical protein
MLWTFVCFLSLKGFTLPVVSLDDLSVDDLTRNTFVGYAYEIGSNQFIYTESHEEFRQDGKLIADRVTYRCPDDKVIAQKIVRFDDNVVAPNFLKNDKRTGFTEGALQRNNSLVLMLKRQEGEDLKETILQKPEELVIDAGFNQYVIEHWDALTSGERRVFHFAIPKRDETFKFRLEQIDEKQFNGRKVAVFKMALDSFFLRLIVNDIIVGYDAETRRLAFYKGLSNIRDDKGELYKANIKFPHEEYAYDVAANSGVL